MALVKYGYATWSGPPDSENTEASFAVVALAGRGFVEGPEKRMLFLKNGRNFSQA